MNEHLLHVENLCVVSQGKNPRTLVDDVSFTVKQGEVLGLIGELPDRCRQVFRARRIYGMSQNETAQCLRVTENVVEKENMRGLKLLSDMIARVGVDQAEQLQQTRQGAAADKKPYV